MFWTKILWVHKTLGKVHTLFVLLRSNSTGTLARHFVDKKWFTVFHVNVIQFTHLEKLMRNHFLTTSFHVSSNFHKLILEKLGETRNSLEKCPDAPWCWNIYPQKREIWLVIWNIFYFSIQLGIIIPIDFHIFQRDRYTTNQKM